MKTRSSLLAVGLLAMAALPDTSNAQQGVPSRYGYRGESAARQQPRPPQAAPRPAAAAAAAKPVKKNVTAAPKKPTAAKPTVAKAAAPVKKAKAPALAPVKKAVAAAKPAATKKPTPKSAPKAVAAAKPANKITPKAVAAATPRKSSGKSAPAAAGRADQIAKAAPKPAAPARRIPTPAAAKPESRKTAVASATRSPASPTTTTSGSASRGSEKGGLQFLGMNMPVVWTASAVSSLAVVNDKHTVDLAGAQRDLEQAQPKPKPAPSRVEVAETPVSQPVSDPAPAPKNAPVEEPDTSFALAGSPVTEPAATDMPPPPEANVVDRAQTTLLTHNTTPSPGIRSAADDMPLSDSLGEPALPEPEAAPESEPAAEPEPEPTPETEPAMIAARGESSAPEPSTYSAPAEAEAEAEPETEPALLALDDTAPATSSLLDVEEPPLPSNDPPPPVHEDEPATRKASLQSREEDLVRTITTAVKSGGKDHESASRAVKAVASQWFDNGKTPKVADVKAAAREIIADHVPDLPMEMSSDLLPSSPEAMPDRMPKFNAPATGKIDIQSDRQADYDQANNRVTFTGKVELNSSTLRLRADMIEVSMKKDGGMDVIHATGNVLMRTQDNAASSGQIASAGSATYDVKSGEIVLSDWPKIQETGKALISTDPSTKMYLYTDGRLRTEGPNRTIIGR